MGNAKNTHIYLEIGDSLRGSQQVNGKKNVHILKFWPYRDSHSQSQQVNAKNTHTYLKIGDSLRGSQQVNGKKNAHILKFWPYRDSHSPSQQGQNFNICAFFFAVDLLTSH